MRTYGLIGKNLTNKLLKNYFKNKFKKEHITNSQYLDFEIQSISDFKELLKNKKISGLNVTIPYKESIIKFLDELSFEAGKIGAVNTIQIKNGKLVGHNTDHIGFTKSIYSKLDERKKAIILGNGGAAKAIRYSLNKLGIIHKTISRNSKFNYSDFNASMCMEYDIIINTTPLGVYPDINSAPEIPYELLSNKHLLFDLTYNPLETKFLKNGKINNTKIQNGLNMLEIQAEESWKIWNKKIKY